MLRISILVLLMACSSSKPEKLSRDLNRPGLHLVYSMDLEEIPQASRSEAQEEAIEIIGQRLLKMGIKKAAVGPVGEGIGVVLPELPSNDLPRLLRMIERRALLEFRIVDEAQKGKFLSNDFMSRLCDFSKSDSKALERGITAGIDEWYHSESGADYNDFYLQADDRYGADAGDVPCAAGSDCKTSGRRILMNYLMDLGRREPTLRIDEEHSFGFERLNKRDRNDIYTGDTFWRSYYLHRDAIVSGRDIEKAYVENDEYSNHPSVMIKFTAKGAKGFAELTRNNTGRKLAIVLDGTVTSAPTIQEEIPGGSCQITLGTIPADRLLDEARDLASLLQAGALPAAMRLESQIQVP